MPSSIPPEHGRNRGNDLIGAYSATMIMAIIAVAVRLYVRTKLLRKLWWDDLSVYISLVRSNGGSLEAGFLEKFTNKVVDDNGHGLCTRRRRSRRRYRKA